MAWDSRANFERSLAVVIGIDHYDNPGIRHLSTAVNDARAIADLLQTDYGYKEENIIRLLSPRPDDVTLKDLKQPYRQATLDELTTLLNDELLNKLKPTDGDRLLFYFAGHGIPQESKDGKDGPAGYLIPQTATLGDLTTYFPMRALHDALSKLDCHHLLVVLDCCFGGMFRWASSRDLIAVLKTVRREHYDRFIRYPAWQVISSAAHNQEALDLSRDHREGKDKSSRHSPFAQALIEGLQQNKADIIPDGVITAHELYLYLNDRVSELSENQQTPGIYPMRLDYDRGEYIFTRPNFKRDDLDPAPELNEENNPYRGLKSFDERHSAFFFGRKALIEDLSNRLSKPGCPLTIVLGASGSGKSSLVKAGLIPSLRESQKKNQQSQAWYILDPMRPGKSPFTELARTILSIADSSLVQQLDQMKALDQVFEQTETEQLGDRSKQKQQSRNDSWTTDAAFTKLADAWNSATPGAKLLLIVDYFKQLEILDPSEAFTNLRDTIQAAVDQLASDLRTDLRGLTAVIATWSQTKPNIKLLLVIDQFEDLITMAQEHQDSNPSGQREREYLSIFPNEL